MTTGIAAITELPSCEHYARNLIAGIGGSRPPNLAWPYAEWTGGRK